MNLWIAVEGVSEMPGGTEGTILLKQSGMCWKSWKCGTGKRAASECAFKQLNVLDTGKQWRRDNCTGVVLLHWGRYDDTSELSVKPFHRNAICCTDPVFHSLIASALSERCNSMITRPIKTESICSRKFNTSFGKHNFCEELSGCQGALLWMQCILITQSKRILYRWCSGLEQTRPEMLG